MIFTRLELKNFKSHKSSVIDFSNGINIILGENGAGKSSIFEAISFALFKQHDGKINNLINSNISNKHNSSNNSMSVSLDFNVNGNNYRVIRKRTETKSNSELFFVENVYETKINSKNTFKEISKDNFKEISKDNFNDNYKENASQKNENKTKLVSGEKEVNSEIERILTMDAELFLNAIYIKQGEIADLITKTPAEKKKLIAKLLGIESLENAWKNSNHLLNVYESKKERLKALVETGSKLDKRLKDLNLSLKALNIEESDISDEIKKVDMLFKEKTEKIEVLENKKKTFNELRIKEENEIKNLKSILKDKEILKKQLNQIEENEKKIKDLKTNVEKLPIYESFLESQQKVEKLFFEKNNLISEKNAVEKYQSIVDENKQIFKEYTLLENELKSLINEKNEIEGDLKVLSEIHSQKEELGKEIKNDSEKIINFFKILKEKVFSLYDNETEDFEKLSRFFVSKTQELNMEKNEFQKTIETIQGRVASYNEKIKNSNEGIEDLNTFDNECPLCLSSITDEKKENLINSYNEVIKKNNQLLKSDNKYIASLKLQMKEVEDKISDLESIKPQIPIYSSLKEKIKESIIKSKKFEAEISLLDIKNRKQLELITKIDKKEKRFQEIKKPYENYAKSKGALEALPKLNVLKNQEKQFKRQIDKEVSYLKEENLNDSFLKLNVKEELLLEKINLYKNSKEYYNKLLGAIESKKSLIKQLEDKEKEIFKKETYINQLNENLKENGFNEEEFEKNKLSYENTRERLNQLNGNLKELIGKKTVTIENIEDLSQQLGEFEENKNEFSYTNEFLVILKDIRTLFSKDGVQKDLRNRSKPIIEKNTNSFFEDFNFPYSSLKLDDDFDISVIGSNGETNLSMVSGGEKIAIALALRLAITESLSSNNMETILLDEPTIHLDQYRRKELIEILRGMNKIPQIIIVTHDEELETAADVIFKVEKTQGISKVKIQDNIF
ncbi:AAA family ATPase [Methanobrevibacter curvatus]|uniref:DNA double-strand break repair Rad50 ATPase n=1 Tax=Methanobrevibacter curvatus TaxID=49547 RepID=A0A165YX64_9EURY|nr:SMC family ATPase [Methanobrevibacter curvatus]KZX09974.1 putative DNA double-strand break repair Rad50 ATPase [Methanobrevibacter curvatus]